MCTAFKFKMAPNFSIQNDRQFVISCPTIKLGHNIHAKLEMNSDPFSKDCTNKLAKIREKYSICRGIKNKKVAASKKDAGGDKQLVFF